MTRQDVISTLRDLISGRRRSAPPAWHIEDRGDGDLRISVDGARFEIDVRIEGQDADTLDDIFDAMTRFEKDAFARGLDEAADEAEREATVAPADLRRSLDDAIGLGLAKGRDARRSIR